MRLAWRPAISAGFIGAILAICSYLPHIDHATVALLMVLAIVGLATMWGQAEALTGAVIGSLGFDYYFLPPHGFAIAAPEHWVALVAFLIAAIGTGQLAAAAKRGQIKAVDRQRATEKIYKLVNAMLESRSAGLTTQQLTDALVEIFGADGVALYDRHTEQIIRSGPHADAISDLVLHETATSGLLVAEAGSAISLAPVRHGRELMGSLGIRGVRLSGALLNDIAGRAALGLARLFAIEKTNEADAVRRSEELKSAVLDAMAHEIRNPLNSVKLAVTSLLSGHTGSDLYKAEMLTIINEEVNRMDRFIDDTVQLARLEADDLCLRKEPQNVAHLIRTAIGEISALAGRSPIDVRVSESLPPAECDEDMIVRVLKQLLANALKYSPQDSPLTVSVNFKVAAIIIDVVDRGPGVEDEERERIFEKYYRGRAARSGASGTGLGLASARSIVRAHGGEIWVTSPPTGGAAFHVSLPAASASSKVAAP
jgi:two-component system, OmpR family, sensor histidine kinase KdpD